MLAVTKCAASTISLAPAIHIRKQLFQAIKQKAKFTALIVRCLALLMLIASYQVGADVPALNVEGNRIKAQGQPISFAGNSLFWSNHRWGGEKYYNKNVVAWLRKDWDSRLIRAAMGVEANGGYLERPFENSKRVRKIVESAIHHDMYVIIDWHSHHAERHPQQAMDFFSQMAKDYGRFNNVIYEIYNEPLNVDWSETIKPYAEQVIAAIRKHDPDNLIIVGTPNWAQDVDKAALDPINQYSNIAYSLHFYAAQPEHRALRKKAEIALAKGLALFVTEYGTVEANGDGELDEQEMALWLDFMQKNGISHANWSINDKQEGASALKPGASEKAGWPNSQLTASGQFVRKAMRQWNAELPF